MRHLRIIMSIKWQDKVSNNEVLKRNNTSGVKAMIMAVQLMWSGYILKIGDCKLSRKILYDELKKERDREATKRSASKTSRSRI